MTNKGNVNMLLLQANLRYTSETFRKRSTFE